MRNEAMDPRVVRTRERVLTAARDLLATEGQAAVTPTRLSRETGVSRSTLYRNWDSPAEIMLDAIADESARPPFEPTGDPREDLTSYLGLLRTGLGMPHTNLLATRIERAEHDPDTAQQIRSANENRRNLMAGILQQTPEEFVEAHSLVVGPLFFQHFLAREPITDELIALVVDAYIAVRQD